MDSTIRIRKATIDDIAALSSLALETYIAAFGDSMSAEDLAAHLGDNLLPQSFARILEVDVILVAEADGRLIGYTQFGKVDPSFSPIAETDQELRRLYVLAEYQNQGIGTKLINTALEHPVLKNAERIYLDVWERNHGALKLYKRYGFTVVGPRKFEVKSGAETSSDLIMVRQAI
jgi:ribosomal protein S18 acetylase RimI-like enzyme